LGDGIGARRGAGAGGARVRILTGGIGWEGQSCLVVLRERWKVEGKDDDGKPDSTPRGERRCSRITGYYHCWTWDEKHYA